jgi:FKBP-type peptidyl-prolyl cis-trans isomerase
VPNARHLKWEPQQLAIALDLGGGEQGASDTIPPTATLIFEVEL